MAVIGFCCFIGPGSGLRHSRCWIGRERKRGKLEDLNAFLARAVGDILLEGRLKHAHSLCDLAGCRYAASSRHGSQHDRDDLSSAEPRQIDPKSGIRSRGFTIIQPRVSIALPGATATRFTRIFSDAQGTDPYCTAVSDAQQDLLGEAIFHGKAIYDVAGLPQDS